MMSANCIVDPGGCAEVMKVMNTGYDSDINQRHCGSLTMQESNLEWTVLPSERIGFDGLARGAILKPNQVPMG